LDASENNRLSVSVVDVAPGRESEFGAAAQQLAALLVRKRYGVAEAIRDEAHPLRFYLVRRWTDAAAAAASHADPEVQELAARVSALARVTHVVHGARPADPLRLMLDEQRSRLETDRRAGFDRRIGNVGRSEGERRSGSDRRAGPRRLHDRAARVDLAGAARRAREHADGPLARARVGAALATADGQLVTGSSIDHGPPGTATCAERVAVIKALSEGHREFSRIAIAADIEQPPCDACRQLLSTLGGNLEVQLADSTGVVRTYRVLDEPGR
jgi:cytidine deaminase/quinol monooxygenase YgiN